MNRRIRVSLDKIGENPYLFNFLQWACNLGDLRNDVATMLGVSMQDSILDVGCGTGLYSTLAKARYLGIDVNESYIKYARRRYADKNKVFVVGDITKLDTKGELFDNILYLAMLHHFDEEDNLRILQNVSKITRKKIMILDLTIPRKPTAAQKFFLNVERGRYLRPLEGQLEIIKRVLNVTEVKAVLNKSRFGLFSVIACSPKK